jgi:hypothetical protein
MGCLALFLLLFVVVIVLAQGGGGDQQAADEGGGQDPEAKNPPKGEKAKEQKPEPQKYSVGQTATVANVVWKVSDAYLTDQLKSTFGTQKRGRFVVVDFTFTNNRDEEVTLDPQLHMILKDSQGREFGSDPDAWEFVPTNLNLFLEPVNPGLSKDGRVVYQVPPDANGFTLTLDDVELMEDKTAVFDLGSLGPRAYDPSSASATATATASATAGQ